MHFAAEEFGEQRPDLFRRDRLAGAREGRGEVAALDVEANVVSPFQPVGEMRHHVQQHLVAIGNQERPAHRSSASRAATRSPGLTPIVWAISTRSGSWFSRKRITAASRSGSPARSRKSA